MNGLLKEKDNQLKKTNKTLNKTFTEEDIKMVRDLVKSTQFISQQENANLNHHEMVPHIH